MSCKDIHSCFDAGYKVFEQLGQGGFAKVYRALRRVDHTEVALKAINKQRIKNKDQIKRVQLEVKIQKGLKHPNIVELVDYFEDRHYVYLVLEYCNKGELAKYLKEKKCLPEHEARNFFSQILNGLKYLQCHNIMHRDLSLGNMLLCSSKSDYILKISDFGLAKELKGDLDGNQTMCGTPNFISPENLLGRFQGPQSDVWSLGCILFAFLTGNPPFESGSCKATIARVVKGEYNLPSEISKEAKDLISRMLQVDPARRISIEQIENHPFLNDFGTNFTFDEIKSAKDELKANSLFDNDPGRNYAAPPGSGSSANDFRSQYCGQMSSFDVPSAGSQSLGIDVSNVSKSDVVSSLGLSNYSMFSEVSQDSGIIVKVSSHDNTTGSVQNQLGNQNSKQMLSPLNTARLRPIRQLTRNLIMTITEEGEAVLEFLKMKKGKRKINDVFRVSSNGLNVILYHVNESNETAGTDSPVPVPSNKGSYMEFAFDELPCDYWKKYQCAAKFVHIVRSKTHKITLFTPDAKCLLMESSPDFEVMFNNRHKISLVDNASFARIEVPNKPVITVNWNSLDLSCFSQEIQSMLYKTRQWHSFCLEQERHFHSLPTLEFQYFPLTIGRRY